MRIAIADDLSADAEELRQFLKAAKPCLQALPRIPLM